MKRRMSLLLAVLVFSILVGCITTDRVIKSSTYGDASCVSLELFSQSGDCFHVTQMVEGSLRDGQEIILPVPKEFLERSGLRVTLFVNNEKVESWRQPFYHPFHRGPGFSISIRDRHIVFVSEKDWISSENSPE